MSKKIKPYLQLLRIKEWRAYFFLGIFGFLLAKGFLFSLRDIIFFFLIGLLLLAFGFSVNDCFDIKEDKYLKDKKIIVAREISFKRSLIFSMFLGIFALALSALFGQKVFFFCFFSALIGFFYSAPPLRFKGKPFLDLFSHGLFAGSLIFLFPFIFFKVDFLPIHYLIAFSIFILSIMAEMRNHLEDYEADKKAGLRTTVSFLGHQKAKRILTSLAFLSPFLLFSIFYQTSLKYLLLFFILTLIFFFLFFLKGNYRSLKKYKIMDFYVFFSFLLILLSMS